MTQPAPATPYLRARITGTLTVESPLHVGSGEAVEIPLLSKKDRQGSTLANALSKDASGRPYIPATTLRGALRERLHDEEARERLFGKAHDGENGTMGRLRCYDAVLDPGQPGTSAMRSGTAIDPLLGAVAAHRLFTRETVLPGSKFRLELEADAIGHDDLSTLVGLLAGLGDELAGGVGAGKSKSQGRLTWTLEKTEFIDAAGLRSWLENDQGTLAGAWKVLKESPAPRAVAPRFAAAIAFAIDFHAPWLVDAPELHREKSAAEAHPPDLEFSRHTDGRAWLPASSLKGWLRARARRILVSLCVGKGLKPSAAGEKAERMLGELFGDTRQAGWLLLTDAYSEKKIEAPHRQQFVAIDRFTGGSNGSEGESGGALYNVNAAPPCRVNGKIGWRKAPAGGDWRLALLALLARDALEGDLALGWGKARGYGQGRARLVLPGGQPCDDWLALAGWLKASNRLQNHLEALKQKIDSIASEADHD